MRHIFLVLVTLLVAFNINVNAQCSQTLNDFEMRLLNKNDNKIMIQMRYNAGGVADAQSVLPSSKFQLDGLVFAISWPTTSKSIEILSCNTLLKPFSILIDKESSKMSSARTASYGDNISTLYNAIDMPAAFDFNWEDKKWYDVVEIAYSGKLNANDFFSLMNCDYGLSHPNSYEGNSTTDPWFAIMNPSGEYLQFSPRMFTELNNSLLSSNTFKIYPNPTTQDLNIDIESQISTQVAVSVSDVTGKLIKTIVYKLEKGNNNTVINLADIAQGNYFIKITDGKTINYSQKISKL